MLDESKQMAQMAQPAQGKPSGVRVKRGRIESISGSMANVVIDGDDSPTPIPNAAPADAAAGMRAIVLCDGTVWAVIAVYR